MLIITTSSWSWAQFGIKGLENLDNPFKKENPMCSIDLAYKEGRNEAAERHTYVPRPSRLFAVGHGCTDEKIEKMKEAFVRGAKDAETQGKFDDSVHVELNADTKKEAEKFLPKNPFEGEDLVPKSVPKRFCMQGNNGVQCGWNCLKIKESKKVVCGTKKEHFCFEFNGVGACGAHCKKSLVDGVVCRD